MALTIAGIVLICLGLLVGATMAVRRSPESRLTTSADWINELSVDRYRPMLRLLRSDDLDFLRRQPGYRPHMEGRLRAQRCRLFMRYLRNLETDYSQVSAALKILMLQSERDRPDLARTLLRMRWRFVCGAATARIDAQLFRWGIGAVDPSELLRLFGSLHREWQELAPAPGAATV
jgi:hypothetical protein